MTPEEKNRIRNALSKCTAAVNCMMDRDVADEEKAVWINVYNYYMGRIMGEYLADEPAPVEAEPVEAEVLPAEPEQNSSFEEK